MNILEDRHDWLVPGKGLEEATNCPERLLDIGVCLCETDGCRHAIADQQGIGSVALQ